MSAPTGDHRVHARHLATLALILILAASLRIAGIARESMSGDELGSLEVAAGRGQVHLILPRNVVLHPPPPATILDNAPPVWNVPTHMESDVHPPLYFIILRLWEDVFGSGDVACRALSAMAGVLGVLVLFDVGRLIASSATGLWAALLMSLAQPEIIYSQDARPYAVVSLFVLLAMDALLRIVRNGPRATRMAALFLSLTAACLTHYFVLPIMMAMGIYAILRLRGKARINVVLTFFAAGVFVLSIWGPRILQQRNNFTDPWMFWFYGDEPHHVLFTLARMAPLPMRYLSEPRDGSIAACLAAVLYVFPFFQARKNPDFILPGFMLLGSAAMMVGLDLYRGTHQIETIKYSLMAAPAVYLILASVELGKRTWIVPLAAAVACVLVFPQTYETVKSDFRGAGRLAGRVETPGEVIVISGGGWGEWYGGLLFLAVEHYSPAAAKSIVMLTSPATAELEDEIAGSKTAGRCLLLTCWTSQPPAYFLPGWSGKEIGAQPGTYRLCEMTRTAKP